MSTTRSWLVLGAGVGSVGLVWLLAQGVSVYQSTAIPTPSMCGRLANDALTFVHTISTPFHLLGLIAATLAFMKLPVVVDHLVESLPRLIGIKAFGGELLLAPPSPPNQLTDRLLRPGQGDPWSKVGGAWERLCPLQEGSEIHPGAPPNWDIHRPKFEQAFAEAARHAVGWDDELWKAIKAIERPGPNGWSGEYIEHLAYTASELDKIGFREGEPCLKDDLARALLFRRVMIIDFYVKNATPGGDQLGNSLWDLFRSSERFERSPLKEFVESHRLAAVLALGWQAVPNIFAKLEAWAADRDEAEGVRHVAREVAATIASQRPPDTDSSVAFGRPLWWFQEIIRAQTWPNAKGGPDYTTAKARRHAIALLANVPITERFPAPLFRATAARIAARCGGLPGDTGAALIALAPEILTDPIAANDLAVSVSRRAPLVAKELLDAAATMGPDQALADRIRENLALLAGK